MQQRIGTIASWRDCSPDERRARLRALQALARVFAGPSTSAEVVRLARSAETDVSRLPDCDEAMASLPTRIVRKVLATLAEVLQPPAPPRGGGRSVASAGTSPAPSPRPEPQRAPASGPGDLVSPVFLPSASGPRDVSESAFFEGWVNVFKSQRRR